MKLDRNINPDGRGKYALIKLRELYIDHGDTPDTEFFVIRLKDKYAEAALRAYADAAIIDGESEWGLEVGALAAKAAAHPNKRKPD